MKLAIAVCTFERPEGIARLYQALDVLDVPPGVDVVLIVVDNGGDLVAPPAPQNWDTEVKVEPQRGIAFARNTAVAEARAAEAEALVFFDDDERPRPDCLHRLFDVWINTGASVVQGASRPEFDEQPPAWVVAGKYFERTYEADGQPIPSFRARTSNVLISIDLFEVSDPPFDIRLALTGGEDTFLFRAAESSGHRFVSAASAVVDETVPASRVSIRWLWRRQYRTGCTRSRYLVSTDPGVGRKLKRVLAGLVSIALAPIAGARNASSPNLALAETGRAVAYGLGLLAGLAGIAPAEYSSIHGS